MNEYVIHAKVKNNLILGRVHRLGYRTVSEFARSFDLNQSDVGRLINMKEPALTRDGAWTPTALRLADALDLLPEDLFTEEQRVAQLKSNEAYIELSRQQALSMADPIDVLENSNVVEAIMKVANLTNREKMVLRLRYSDGLTLDECGGPLGVTRERVRGIQNKALSKLRTASYHVDPYGTSGLVREEWIRKRSRQVALPRARPANTPVRKEARAKTASPARAARNSSSASWNLISVLLDPDSKEVPYQASAEGVPMAFTTTQLTAIEEAIASGELTVKYDGKEVTYRNMADLIAARDLIRGELIAAGTITDTTPRRSYAVHSRD
jgi:DNA-directed RNA polymerase specialized sigma24 family protein